MAQDMAYQPLVLVDTAQLSRPDWLEYRRKGLGGSDAAAVLNISPFRTARDLYYDKLGIVTADDQANWVALEVGNLLEPLVARIFAEKTGLKIYQRKCMFQHPYYPWMLADLDYLVELPDGTTAILEIKTTNYNAKDKWWYNGEEIVPVSPRSGPYFCSILNGDLRPAGPSCWTRPTMTPQIGTISTSAAGPVTGSCRMANSIKSISESSTSEHNHYNTVKDAPGF